MILFFHIYMNKLLKPRLDSVDSKRHHIVSKIDSLLTEKDVTDGKTRLSTDSRGRHRRQDSTLYWQQRTSQTARLDSLLTAENVTLATRFGSLLTAKNTSDRWERRTSHTHTHKIMRQGPKWKKLQLLALHSTAEIDVKYQPAQFTVIVSRGVAGCAGRCISAWT